MAITDYLYEGNGKTELGEHRIPHPAIGIVVSLYHKDYPQKVGITIPMLDDENSEVRWADLVCPYMGGKHGSLCKPELNEQVLVFFLDGKVETPLILGSVARMNDTFMKKTANEENSIKSVRFRNGSYLKVEEGKDEEGREDIITIATAQDAHQMVLNNAKEEIVLKDKEENCLLEMQTKEGKVKLHAAKRLTITVGDTIKLDFNGDSGEISISGNSYQLKTMKHITAESDGKVKITAQQTTVEGVSSLSNQTSGMYMVDAKVSNFK